MSASKPRSLDCHTRYYPSFYVHESATIRTFYVFDAIPEFIHTSEHFYTTSDLCELFANMMMTAWFVFSAFNDEIILTLPSGPPPRTVPVSTIPVFPRATSSHFSLSTGKQPFKWTSMTSGMPSTRIHSASTIMKGRKPWNYRTLCRHKQNVFAHSLKLAILVWRAPGKKNGAMLAIYAATYTWTRNQARIILAIVSFLTYSVFNYLIAA
jgi:hypothetical protein